MKNLFYIVLIILFFYTLNIYDGSKTIYTSFTLIYFILFYVALLKPISYSYLYLGVFLFLGMWLKLTLHTILQYAYVEPVGMFYVHETSMDSVLLISMIGAIGVLASYIMFKYLKIKPTIYLKENSITTKPYLYQIYSNYKMWFLIAILVSSIILCYINIIYEIQLSGIVPKTILIYPFNAIISWVIGVGFSILMIVLISMDIKYQNRVDMRSLYVLVLISAITSIGILSRGQYVFILGSVIVFLIFNYKYIKNINFFKLIIFVLVALFIYLFVIDSVTVLRNYFFSGASLSGASLSGAFLKIMHLGVDRWIGLEGIMSVEAYEHKSFKLFFDALFVKPKIGAIDIYQYISNAHYKDMDNTKFAFATIPGAIAFLYYSGSYIFVFVGMFVLTSFMLLLEYLVYNWYKSALLASFLGIYFANIVAQFGLSPVNILKSMFFTFSFLIIVKLLKIKKVS